MELEKFIEKILTIRSLSDTSWDKSNLFTFIDEEINYNFFMWLKENNNELFSEYLTILTGINLELDNSTIIDFLTVMSEINNEEDLIEIIIDFIAEDSDLLEELNNEINNILKKEKDLFVFEDDDYEDDYDPYDGFSKNRYNDYDNYDDEDYY